MTNRKFSRPRILIISALVSLAIFYLVLPHVFPKKIVAIDITRSQAIERGSAFLNDLDLSIDDYSLATIMRFNNSHYAYLQQQLGRQAATDFIGEEQPELFGPHWRITWFQNVPRSSQNESFRVDVSGTGNIIGFSHTVPDSFSGIPGEDVHLTQTAALQIAMGFLEMQQIDLSDYRLDVLSSDQYDRRTDHRFKWKRDFDRAGGTVTHLVEIKGNQPGEYQCYFDLPEDAALAVKHHNSQDVFVGIIAMSIFFATTLLLLVIFLKKYHEGEIGVRSALALLGILWGSMTLEYAFRFRELAHGTNFGVLSYDGVAAVIFIFMSVIVFPFWSLGGFAAWSVGESLIRSRFGDKLTAVDAIINRKFSALSFARSTAQGYLMGFVTLGFCSLLVLLVSNFPGVNLALGATRTMYSNSFSFLIPVLSAISGSLLGEMIFRLFGNLYLSERLKNRWVPALLSSAVWAVFALVFWDFSLYVDSRMANLAIGFVMGLFFTWVLWKYDLLTTIIANFVLIGVLKTLPLITNDVSGNFWSGVAALGFLALPAVPMVAAFIIRDEFEYQPDSTPAHIKRITERERMSRELEIAHQVQMSLLPKSSPEVAGCDIAGICIPAKEVGGDYYDFIAMSNDQIGIVIGDVSGKGVPAAIYMTLTKGVFQSNAEVSTSPREVLVKVNHLMYRTIERGAFVSMFYAVLDMASLTMRFARAGHNPALYYHSDGKNSSMLEPGGIALGLDSGEIFGDVIREQEIPLQHGDIMVFYTDGFTEAMNRDLQEYGEERLTRIIQEKEDSSSKEIVDAVCSDVRKFVRDHPQHDDMTMVVVKIQ